MAHRLLDSHHHLWDMSKICYPWLEAKGEIRFFGQPDPIRKNYLPDDFLADNQNMICASVHVQVGCIPEHNLRETALIDSYIKNGGQVAAIVAAIDVRAANFPEQLEKQLSYAYVKGVRHMIGKSPNENKNLPAFIEKEWIEHWQLLADTNTSFDLQLTSEQYQAVYSALCKVPDLKVVICHFGSPWEQDNAGYEHWCYWMAKFALLPNCHIKLSGLSMFSHSFEQEKFLKYAHKAIAIFGARRCMLGSNFPVDKLYCQYSELLNAWGGLLDSLDTDACEWLSHKSASEFYGIVLP